MSILLYIRKDLARGIVIGSICFGVLYFSLLRLWLIFFPEVKTWFTFQGLPKTFIIGVPAWEVLFGIIFAAYWGGMYELLFGYKLVSVSKGSNTKPHK